MKITTSKTIDSESNDENHKTIDSESNDENHQTINSESNDEHHQTIDPKPKQPMTHISTNVPLIFGKI